MKIKVKSKSLPALLAEFETKLKSGEITVAEAARRQEKAVAENPNLFDDHYADTRRSAEPARTIERPDPAMKFVDRGEATATLEPVNARDAQSRFETAYKSVIAAEPGARGIEALHALCEKQADIEDHREFQNLHDAFTIVQLKNPNWSPRRSKFWPRYSRLASQLVGKLVSPAVAKVMTTGGSGTGAEFIPNTLSGSLIPLIKQELVVANAFPHMTMPTSPWKLPLEGADTKPFLVSETSTDDPDTSSNVIGARSPATSSVTLTAQKFGVRAVISGEQEEDAIISSIAYSRMKIARALAEGLDDCLINGDDSGSHQDADSNTAGDWRKAFKGLRKLTATGAKYDVGNAALTANKLINVLKFFGKFSQNPSSQVIFVSPIGQLHLLGDTNFQRADAVGTPAPLVTGQIGTILGRPIVVSGYVREDMNHAGLYDASTTTRTAAIVAHRDSFAIGDRRQLTVEGVRLPMQDKFVVVAMMRMTFARIQAEQTLGQVARNVGIAYNINKNATF